MFEVVSFLILLKEKLSDIILTNGIAFQIYSEDLTIMSRNSLGWENLRSPVFSGDLGSVIFLAPVGEGGEGRQAGLELHWRKVSVSPGEEQVSIVLTQGRVQPSLILAWDEHNDTM